MAEATAPLVAPARPIPPLSLIRARRACGREGPLPRTYQPKSSEPAAHHDPSQLLCKRPASQAMPYESPSRRQRLAVPTQSPGRACKRPAAATVPHELPQQRRRPAQVFCCGLRRWIEPPRLTAPARLPCPCGLGPCALHTSRTEKHPGRQFFKCPLREGGCGFFLWADEALAPLSGAADDAPAPPAAPHAPNPARAASSPAQHPPLRVTEPVVAAAVGLADKAMDCDGDGDRDGAMPGDICQFQRLTIGGKRCWGG